MPTIDQMAQVVASRAHAEQILDLFVTDAQLLTAKAACNRVATLVDLIVTTLEPQEVLELIELLPPGQLAYLSPSEMVQFHIMEAVRAIAQETRVNDTQPPLILEE